MGRRQRRVLVVRLGAGLVRVDQRLPDRDPLALLVGGGLAGVGVAYDVLGGDQVRGHLASSGDVEDGCVLAHGVGNRLLVEGNRGQLVVGVELREQRRHHEEDPDADERQTCFPAHCFLSAPAGCPRATLPAGSLAAQSTWPIPRRVVSLVESPGVQQVRRTGLRARVSARPVLAAGIAMIAVQLVFRGWAVYGSWFEFDDFAWMSMSLNERLTPSFLFHQYAGHLMPGGFLLSWAFARTAPLSFWLPATTLLLLQAAASIGCFRLLRHMFGERMGILPPLALYLFSVISLPSFIWWAAGINALPFQIALFYGMHSHLTYLRTKRLRYALATLAWTTAGLLFFEKTLYVFIGYGVVALGYFANGWGLGRFKDLWSSYRAAVLLYSAYVLAYLAAYSQLALNFDPNTANESPLGPIAGKLVGIAFSTGIVGGPLRWFDRSSFSHTPDPPDILVLLGWLAIAALVWEVTRARRNSRRAWLLVAVVLLADVVLLAAARAFASGPSIALEYRYQGEVTAFASLAIGLATLPLLGAADHASSEAPSNFLDSRSYVLVATGVVVALSLLSSVQYAVKWQAGDQPRRYFDNLAHDLSVAETPPVLANMAVPEFVLWGLGYPENQPKRMFRVFGGQARFKQATDDLKIVDTGGRVRAAVIPPTRPVEAGPRPDC